MRNRGTFNFSGNLEVKKDAPLDARMLVSSYDDLKKTSTWADEDGNVWFYNYMIVACEDRPGKLYQLIDKTNYVNDEAWKEISGGSGGGTGGGIEEAPTDSKVYGRKNANWSEITVDDVTVKIPVAVSSLTTNATSDDIIRAFGSKEDMAQIAEDLSAYKLVAFVRNTDDRIVIMYIPHFMSQYTDTDKFTMTLEYEMNEIHRTQIISMSGGSASIQVIEVPQADTSVFLFKPSLTSDTNKITQQNYNDLQAAIQANKVIMAPFGFMNGTVDGNYVPVNAYLKSDAIALEYVADDTHSYINIASDLTVSFVNDGLAFEDTTVKFIDSIGTVDLNTVTSGTGVHEAVIAIQTVNSNATLDKNYPVEEAGSLISMGTINGRTNQMYLAYKNADLYARTAGASDKVTSWYRYAKSTEIPTKVSELTNDSNYATVSQIPTNNNQLTNGAGYITQDAVPTKVSQLTNDSNYATTSQIPTDNSQLANGAGYATKEYVDDKDRIANIPYSLFGLTSKSSSSQILRVFGGLSSYKSFVNKLRANNCVIVCGSPEDDSYRYVFDNYTTEWTDENNFNLYMYDNSLRSNLPKAFAFQIKLVNNEASFAKEERDFAIASDVLTKDNTTEYTPTSDYNPAPKAYVDNSISNSRSVGYMMQLTEIDASGLDENTWYPVVMPLGNRNTVRIEVKVALDSGTKPSWSTHAQGFSVRKIWEVNGSGWGTSEINRQIFVSDYNYVANIDPVRGVNQLTNLSNEYVFVRGGGKYFFYTSHGVVPTLYTETLTIEGGQSISPTTKTPAEIVANMATKKYVDGSISNGFYYINNNQFVDYFITPSYYKDSEAETAITQCFNTVDNFKDFVNKALDNGTVLVFLNGNVHEKTYIRDFQAYRGNYNTNFELSFIFNYSSNSEVVQVISTRVFISWNASYGYKFIVRNLVSSDNLTTITKKTSGEYEALTKDDKTMYAVTD